MKHFSAMARRTGEPPISWLMKLALDRPRLISLAAGFTDNDTLPVDEIRAITSGILDDPKAARQALQYGATAGDPGLRRELFRNWQRQDGVKRTGISADDIVVTNGSQQLLHLITEALCDPGDAVLMEDPTYFVYLGIIEQFGIQPVSFDTIETLKSKIKSVPSLKLLYLVTYYRNPTGHTWTLDEKREVLDAVKRSKRPIYIVEDAAYRDLRFEGSDVPSFKSLDPENRYVAYTNTLTKPFATGLKVGYGISPAPLMRSVLRSKGNQDFGTSNFLQAILTRALASGAYQQHLPVIARSYRRKRDAMVSALRQHFPATSRYEVPQGGLYVWVELPARYNTGVKGKLFQRALEAGVLYVPGEMCYCDDSSRRAPRSCMRLSFGVQSPTNIRKGIRLLGSVIQML